MWIKIFYKYMIADKWQHFKNILTLFFIDSWNCDLKVQILKNHENLQTFLYLKMFNMYS